MPLEVEHDVPNFGYVIKHEEFGTLVFCTDAVSFPYKIVGCNYLLIEANYDESLIFDNICIGLKPRSHSENHMEITDALNVIDRHMSPDLKDVVLLHLSDEQSDENAFRQRVIDSFDIPCHIAKAGESIKLNDLST